MAKAKYKQRELLRNQKNNEIIAKITSVFFITIAAVYPVFVGPNGYFNLTYEKTFFFWISTAIAAFALIFMLICVKGSFIVDRYYTDDEPARKVTVAEWALLGFIAWTFISAFIAHWLDPVWLNLRGERVHASNIVWFGEEGRYEGFISFLAYAVCFMIISRFYKPRRLHLLLVAGGAVIVSLIGVLQFLDLDIFGLFPFYHESLVDAAGNPTMGPLSAFFRTTMGNVNIVSAYVSFAIMLFAALFTVAKSKWQYLYLGAGALSFALSLTTGHSGDAHAVAVLGSMILLIPYWISRRERLGRILIVLSTWLTVYTGHNAYMSAMRRQYEAGRYFASADAGLLNAHTPVNAALFLCLAAVLAGAGLALVLLLKKWPDRVMRIVGIVILPVMFVGGLVGLEIVGSRISDQPNNIIWQAREMMHGRFVDEFGSARVWIWRNAIEVLPENPIFGTGPDTFYHALGIERQTEAATRYNVVFDKAHNMFIQIAVCMGIPALIAFLIFLGGVFVPSVKRAFERPVLFAFGAAALGYLIQSFFMVEVPITTPLLWISLGVMAGEVWMHRLNSQSIEV